MKLLWSEDRARYETISEYSERQVVKDAGFRWDPAAKTWWTTNDDKAMVLAWAGG